MKTKIFCFVTCFILMLIFPLMVCETYGIELAKRQVLRYALGAPDLRTGSLDPIYANATPDLDLLRWIYNGLVRYRPGDPNVDNIEPDLAERWEKSSDGLVWTFRLRKGVQFHKGFGEATAEDVKFTFERSMDPKYGSGWGADYKNFKKIEVIDKYTIKIYLNEFDPWFLLKVNNNRGGCIVSKRAVEAFGKEFKSKPVGTGPFAVEEYHPKNKIIFVKNENYFRGKPILEKVELLFLPDVNNRTLALKAKEIDVAEAPMDINWINARVKEGFLVDYCTPFTQTLHLNLKVKPFDDLRVRKAIMYAINQKEFIDFFGALAKPAYSHLVQTDSSTQAAKDVLPTYKYDPEKAKELLKEAGYPNGFTIEQDMSEYFLYFDPMQIVQNQLRKVGIKLKLNIVDHVTYKAKSQKDQLPTVILATTRETPDLILSEYYHSSAIVGRTGGIYNFSHYGEVGRGIDDLKDQARQTLDERKRRELYVEAQKRLMEDLPSIPLYFTWLGPLARWKHFDLGYEFKGQWGAYNYQLTENSKILLY